VKIEQAGKAYSREGKTVARPVLSDLIRDYYRPAA
jgi:hypothetical protein